MAQAQGARGEDDTLRVQDSGMSPDMYKCN